MSPLKFSSAASRSIEGAFLSAPGYQSFPYVRRREPSLDFLSNDGGLFLSPLEVGGDFSLVPQVVRDHGVDVRQGYGGVLLRNLLGGRASVERRDNGVERHPRTSDTHDAVGISVNWEPAQWFRPSSQEALLIRLHGPDPVGPAQNLGDCRTSLPWQVPDVPPAEGELAKLAAASLAYVRHMPEQSEVA